MSIPNLTSNGNMSGSGDASDVDKPTVVVENADADARGHEPVQTIQQTHSESGSDTPSLKMPAERPPSDAEDDNPLQGDIYSRLQNAVDDDELMSRLLREMVTAGSYLTSEPMRLRDIYHDWGQNKSLDAERVALDLRIITYVDDHLKCVAILEAELLHKWKRIQTLDAIVKEKTSENKTLKSANRYLHHRLVRASSKLAVTNNMQPAKTTHYRTMKGLLKQSKESKKKWPKESIEPKDNKVGNGLEPQPNPNAEEAATSALELNEKLLPAEPPQRLRLQRSPNSALEDLDKVQPASGKDE